MVIKARNSAEYYAIQGKKGHNPATEPEPSTILDFYLFYITSY